MTFWAGEEPGRGSGMQGGTREGLGGRDKGGSRRVRNGAAKGTAAEDGGRLGLRDYERVRLGDRCQGPDWKNPSWERSRVSGTGADSHGAIDDQSHQHIDICHKFLQIGIWQLHL